MEHVLASSSQLGLLLKAARKRARLSQGALAARIGISQSRMSELELNPGAISLDQLLAIAGVLGLELAIGNKPSSAAVSAYQVAEPTAQAATASAGRGAAGRKKTLEW